MKNDPSRCDERTSGPGLSFPQCKYRWAVKVTLRNGEVRRVCRVHLRPLNRQDLAVEISSPANDAKEEFSDRG